MYADRSRSVREDILDAHFILIKNSCSREEAFTILIAYILHDLTKVITTINAAIFMSFVCSLMIRAF